MKLNKTVYAAVIDNKILGHPEGDVINEDRATTEREAFGVWADICGWDRSRIEIVKVKIIRQD